MNQTNNGITYGEELISLVHGLASDQLISQFLEINQLLVTAGFTNQIDAFNLMDNAISLDEMDVTEVVAEVDSLLRESTRICLLECGVMFEEEISMDLLIELTKAVLHFDTTETPDLILGAIEASDDDHEAFLSVLEIVTSRDSSEWLTVVTDVGYGLIDRIKSLTELAAEANNVVDDVDYEFNAKLSKLMHVGDKETLESLESLKSTPNLDTLYVLHAHRLMEESTAIVVKSLYSLACVAYDNFDEAYLNVGKLLDDFYVDPIERHEAELLRNLLKNDYASTFGDIYEEERLLSESTER